MQIAVSLCLYLCEPVHDWLDQQLKRRAEMAVRSWDQKLACYSLMIEISVQEKPGFKAKAKASATCGCVGCCSRLEPI